jgi:flagellar assembly factor FliW
VQIETRAFGSVVIDDAQIVVLTRPMPGFAPYRRFAVLEPDPECPIKWFQSVEREDLCFLLMDPQAFFPDYRLALGAADLSDLDIGSEGEAAVGVVLTIPGDFHLATANLLAPIVFNTDRKLARQVILEGSGYPIRAPLFQEEKEACQAG